LLIIVALAASVDRGIAAEYTPTSAPIETDRPDVTNSSFSSLFYVTSFLA
jgi:hypothetical protein